jgi:hypothetical protein
MPRKLILFAVIAVVGTMLALYFVTRSTATSESSADSSPSNSNEYVAREGETRDRTRPSLPADPHQPPQPNRVEPGKNPKNVDPTRPQASTVESVERGTNADQVHEPTIYTLPDGRVVRDFRDPSRRVPLEKPPTMHAPGGRKIQPQLTEALTNQIVPHIKECGKAVPAEARGDRPRLEGQIVIAIKAGQATVTGAVFKLTNITSDSLAETARQCVEQKTLTVKVPASGEADLDAYSINMSLAFL